MSKLNLSQINKGIQRSLSKHSPQILIGLGVAGMITTTALAVKATPKALYLIEEKKNILNKDKLTPVEVVKATWKCYVPAAVTGAVSIACVIGSNSVNVRRNAALATAYKLSETAFAEYRDKTIETIGDKKEAAIRDKISEDNIKNNPISKSEIFMTGKGGTLFFDPLSGRYFMSDLEKIRKVENKLNKEIICDPFDNGVTLNDFYEEIGLPGTSTGDAIGWKLSDLIDIYPSAQMAEDGSEYEGQPCIVLNFRNPPRYDFL